MKITQNYKIWFMISSIIILAGVIGYFTMGLNLGIDFSGGTMIQVNMGKMYEVPQIKEDLKSFDLNPEILHAGADKSQIIIRTKKSLGNEERIAVFTALKDKYALQDTDLIGAEQFGPSVGAEIRNKAFLSIMLASIGILAYVSFRFEWRYGIAAVLALFHDVLVVLSVYVLLRIPVNSAFIAAILTVVGYSINDTIVVFDRIRDNIKTTKLKSMLDLANESVLQTIARSVNTSLTTLFVIVSLYIFGVTSIKELALPLMAGIITGTYSSIFIASPIWALLKQRSHK